MVHVMKCERVRLLKRRVPGITGICEDYNTRSLVAVRVDLVGKNQLLVPIAIEICKRGIRFGAEIDAIKESAGLELVIIGVIRVGEFVEVIRCRCVRIERAPENTHVHFVTPIRVQVGEHNIIVSAGLGRCAPRKRHGCVLQDRLRTRPGIRNQQHTRFEKVTPEKIEIPVSIVVVERHRVGAVAAALQLANDLDVLESIGLEDEARQRRSSRRVRLHVPDGSIHSSNKQIEPAVAVEIVEVRDVLSVRKNRNPRDITKRVFRRDPFRRTGSSLIPNQGHVTVRFLDKQVLVAITFHVDEAMPFTNVQ